MIGREMLNDKINQTLFNFAVLTKDPEVIEKSLSYWEQRAEKYPKQSFLSKIYHLYYLQQNKVLHNKQPNAISTMHAVHLTEEKQTDTYGIFT